MWFQFFMWVVSFVIADYFRERLPSQTASGIGDFNIPTATEGRVVPIIPGGSIRCNALNCIWYGDFAAIERTVTTGVIFKDEETIGFTYELALQYAICKSELAGIVGIWIGDDEVFNHDTDAAGVPQTVVDVDRDDLFGGTDNGGGFQARFRLFNGSETQGVSTFLNSRIDPLPAYTGTAYVMVTGIAEDVGATIGESNNLRYIRVAVQAFDTVANGALGDVLGLGNDHHFIGPDANPISVAYDLFTNTIWGRSRPPSEMDLASFQAAAETVFTEGIGYSQIIDEQTTTGDIQDTIEQHVDGYIGPNAITGRIEVTLARFDYVLANEFQANASNIQTISKWTKGDWSQTFNRIRIRYTDRAKQWKETHAVELASGNRIIQGRTVTKELRYQGVHTAEVASKIAARSKKSLAEPTGGGTITLDRTAYELRPGSVFSLTSEKIGENNTAVRVTKATIGNVERGDIVLEVVTDQFDTEIANNAIPPPSDFVPPIQVVVPFLVADQAATEPPFILMRLNNLPNLHPRVATFARRAPGNTPTEYEVIRRTGNPPAGAYISTDFVQGGFMSVGTLRNNETAWRSGNGGFSIQVDPLGAESLDGLISSYSPTNQNAGGICVIDPGLATEEWLAVETIVDDLAGIRLENCWRGCMDTNMKAHTAGDRIWFIWTGGLGMGEETYAPALGVELKLLPRSPTDAVLEAAATALPVVFIAADPVASGRQGKPLHPVEMLINTVLFPQPLDLVDFDRLIVNGTNAGLPGAECLPQQRAFNTQGIIASVMALAADGTGINPTDISDLVLESEEWLHNLDDDPTANRANAVATNSISGQTTATDQFDLLKSDIVAAGVTGLQFNARLEVEITHSPDGQFPNQKTHEAFVLDFVAAAVFSLEPDQVIFGHQFNGDDADVDGLDELARPTLFIGNAEIDTASSEFGGGSVIFDGTGDAVHMASAPGFDWHDSEWTIDFRVRFDDVVGAQVLIGQAWEAPRRQWYLEWDGNSFEFRFSRNGSDGPFTNIALGAFTPTITQWYAIRIVQKKDPTSPRFSCYVDGSRIGTTFTAQSNSESGADWILGARYDGGGVYSLPFTGQIDELEVRPFAAIDPNATSYTVEDRPGPGPAGSRDCLVANLEDVDTATAHRTDDTNRWDLTFGATSEIDTAQFNFGASALRCDGVNSLTPASADGVWLPETLNPPEPLPQWNIEKRDFTFEGFMRFVTLPSSTTDGMALFGKYNRPAGNTVDWAFYWNGSDALTFYYSPTGNISGGVTESASASTLSTGVWYHVAAQRRGDDLELYFDGNRIAQVADHFAGNRLFNNTTNPVTIGRFYDASVLSRIRAMDGWIDGARIHVGRAFYNGSTYTVPTAPPFPGDQADPALRLLHHFDGADFFATDREQETDDGIRSTRIAFGGGARYLDADPKFGVTHGEMDDGDHFEFTPSLFWWDLADDDFTIDIWFLPDDVEAGQNNGGVAFFNHWLETGDERGWRLSFDNATDRLEFVWTTDGTAADEATAFVSSVVFDTLFPVDTWAHVAVERQGSTLSIFVNGVLQTIDGASDSIGTDVIYNPGGRQILVGQQDVTSFSGDSDSFWDEFRITKSAEYGGSTFTPEVAAYPNPGAPNV